VLASRMWNEDPYARLDRPVERPLERPPERLSEEQYGWWGFSGGQGSSASQSLWSRDAPTPPRARPCDDFPQPRASWGASLPVERSRQREARKEQDSWPRQGQTSSFDVYGSREQFEASSSLAAEPARPPPREAPAARETKVLRCERCDEAHATEWCPHFKQPRDQHADAWQHYSGDASRSQGGAATLARECIAPRFLAHHQMRVARMPGDGTCLFHSIAYGLTALGYREAGHTVRRRVANFIADRPDFEITGTPLRSWIEWDSQMTVNSYAARLMAGNCWGGAIEMAACSQIFAIDVAVYEEDRNGGYCRISDFITDKKPYGAVMVLYSGRSHYDALRRASPQDLNGASRRGGYGAEYGAYHPGPEAAEEDEWTCSVM